jgi:hypothetical protein
MTGDGSGEVAKQKVESRKRKWGGDGETTNYGPGDKPEIRNPKSETNSK